jgi:hypothetical protein
LIGKSHNCIFCVFWDILVRSAVSLFAAAHSRQERDELKKYSCIFMLFAMTVVFLSCHDKVSHPIDFFSKNTHMVSSALKNESFRWENRKTGHLDIHFVQGKWTAERIDSLAIHLEDFYHKNIRILGDSSYARRIDVFFVGPKSDVKEIGGQAVTASAMLPERACVFSDSRLAARPQILQHELMHVLSFDIWGIPNDFFMAEGVATAAFDTSICSYQFDAVSKYALQNEKLPSLAALVNSDFFQYDEVAKYMVGASFIEMIEEKYGTNGVRDLWKSGVEKGAIRLGTSLDQLDKELREKINKSSMITDQDWKCLHNNCCDSL